MRWGTVLAAAVAAALAASAPAAAQNPFGLSEQQAQALGAQEHPKIVAQFGGEIADAELKAYVDGIARKLLAVSTNPAEPVKVTVLDSPVVNAMALPGHLYVTRGLLALADTEAELAGVIGHEIGHILEKHAAKRYSRGNLAGLGALVIGAVSGSGDLAQIAGAGAQLYVMRFSRKQEYAADMVGVRLLANAGYDPLGEADFLNTLNRWSALESKIAGRNAAPPEFLSTHPNTAERVKRAAAEAKVLTATGMERGRDAYLGKIDGVVYGDDAVKQGFVRGQDFIHPSLGFAFTVPQGFQIQNTATAVLARSNAAQMQFSGVGGAEGPSSVLQSIGQQMKVQFGNARSFRVAGRDGAAAVGRAQTNNGYVDLHAYVVKWQGAQNWVFLWLTAPQDSAQMQPVFDQAVSTLRTIDAKTANAPPTLRIDVVAAGASDTVASLAAKTAFPSHKEERFRVMNSLEPTETIAPGYRVKVVR